MEHSVLPRYTVQGRALWDLELLLSGGFAPLAGFMTQGEYESVRDTMRLPNGSVWPVPVVLDVGGDFSFGAGDTVLLCDPHGYPLATLAIQDVYMPDKQQEARAVYGTEDVAHFGVRYLAQDVGSRYVGGAVSAVGTPRARDFMHLRHTPAELQREIALRGYERVVAFQTRNPMHRAHVELVRRAAEEHDAAILVHPVVGMTKDGDIEYVTRVRTYEHVLRHRLGDRAMLSLLPLAMRMAGPREALWHALIRKNFGATHFIVGRDHAGPGSDASGKPFYEPYAAQDLVRAHEAEIGIGMITPKEMVYVEERAGYAPVDHVHKSETVERISGTQFRKMLQEDIEIPTWFSYPEVVAELKRSAKRQQEGLVLFFTGLSGAGKSTIAECVREELVVRTGRAVTLLDGDVVRLNLSKGLGFSKEDRNTNIERIGFVAAEVARHGGIALCSAIAPYAEARAKNRARVEEYGRYVEVYISTPLEVCKARDAKGLYEKAEQGLISGFTGVDDPYEVPDAADVVLDTSELTVEGCVERILAQVGIA